MTRLLPVLAALLLAGPALAQPIHTVGNVTWHPASYAGKTVAMKGYLLRRETGYVIFSDEPRGKLSAHDLPVTGPDIAGLKADQKYLLTGRFVKGGLAAMNHNPYHLVLTEAPKPLSH